MTKAQGFDFANLETASIANKGVEIELMHPATSQPTGGFLTLLGTDSDVYRSVLRKQVNARMAREQAAKARGAKVPADTMEDLERMGLEQIHAVTVGWRGISVGGVDFAYEPGRVAEFYERWPWAIEQAREAINDRANFTKA